MEMKPNRARTPSMTMLSTEHLFFQFDPYMILNSINDINIVKHLISAVPHFGGFLNMTYWNILIFAVIFTMAPDSKEYFM